MVKELQYKCGLLSLSTIVVINFFTSSANATQLTLTELQTFDTDGNTTNTPIFSGTEDYTPIGTNVVTGFEINNSGSIIDATNWNALEVNAVGTTKVIQYKQNDIACSPSGSPCNRLYANDAQYIYQDGLSLSTGINKTSSQSLETFTFQVLSLIGSTIGDGNPDIISADIAKNQSEDKWELLDINGDVFAILNTSSSDWNALGTQQLERYDINSNTVENFNDRPISGLAIELSDFTVISTGQALNPVDASSVYSLRIAIEDPTQNPVQPKTDYAFFGADPNSITLGIGQSSTVPFKFSPALGIIISVLMFSSNKLWKKLKSFQIN